MATLTASPSAATNDDSTGVVEFKNLANIGSSNNTYANTEPVKTVVVETNALELVYEDKFDDIPTGSTINGITVSPETHKNTNKVAKIISAQLMKSGTPVGNVKTNSTEPGVGPDDDASLTFGGAADLWGTTWSLSEVKDELGVRLIGEVTIGTDKDPITVLRVDDVPVTITYTPTTTTTTTTASP